MKNLGKSEKLKKSFQNKQQNLRSKFEKNLEMSLHQLKQN